METASFFASNVPRWQTSRGRTVFKSTTTRDFSNESNSALHLRRVTAPVNLHLDLSLFFLASSGRFRYNYSFLCSKNLGL
jgi:hypothetical protein